MAAQPKQLVIGNIVRRVLGLIRDEEDEKKGEGDFSGLSSDAGSSEPPTPHLEANAFLYSSPAAHTISPPREPYGSGLGNGTGLTPVGRPPLLSSHTGGMPPGTRKVTSMFSILSSSPMRTSGSSTPIRSGVSTPLVQPQSDQAMPHTPTTTSGDLRAEIIEGISEIIDELDQADDQIASYAPEHIHANETIFTYSSSLTVQRFLLKAASKRKFTVIHAEGYPNNHTRTHSLITGSFDPESQDDQMTADSFSKSLTSAGVTVILVPDSAIFALMSRANKVVLGANAILANGSVLAAAGTNMVAKAARHHRVPVVVLCGTFKLSPVYPHDPESFIEFGSVEKVVGSGDGEMREAVSGVVNPLTDFVDVADVDLFVTNLGGCSTGYVYRVIRDQYREEDLEL